MFQKYGLAFDWESGGSRRAVAALDRVLARHPDSTGFLNPPGPAENSAIVRYVSSRRKGLRFYCVIGIGGSAIPVRALHDFFARFRKPAHAPEIRALDTTDPEAVSAQFEELLSQPQRSLFHVISKSGSTLEVELLRRRLESLLSKKLAGRWQRQVLVTTTPNEGNPLQRWALRHGLPLFPLAADIGGRFSTFSPVAYVTAAFLGLDLDALSRGAGVMAGEKELAADFAARLYGFMRRGRRIAGLFLYGEELAGLGQLLKQLFAESLGKDRRGFTPTEFSGPRDQHSVLQLYLDGPADKFAVMVSAAKETTSAEGRAFKAAQWGVRESLKARKVPVLNLRILKRSPQSYGALVQFFHLATVALGALINVNPFDQPMVELQKRLTLKYLKA